MIHRVHITTEESWICRRLSEHLQALDGFRVRVTCDPPRDTDLTYFLTYLFREFYKPVGKCVALFTHYVPGKHQDTYNKIASQVDHCVALSSQHAEYLKNLVGEDKVTRVHLPVKFSRAIPRLRVGWFHRSPDGYGRRKRTDLLEFVRQLSWVELVASPGNWSESHLHAQMQAVDVFLTTSDYESGPVSLLEGLSLGKSIVIPRGVGLADEYADIPGVHLFEPGSQEDLESALWDAYEPLRVRYSAVSNNTVERWKEDHRNLFTRLLSIK